MGLIYKYGEDTRYNLLMKIGIDCQYLGDSKPAGPEKYTINVVSYLLKTDFDNDYFLYFKKEPSEELSKKLAECNSNCTFKILDSSFSWTQLSLSKEIRQNPPDVFFSPFHTLPIFNTLRPFRQKRIKWVSMVHGIDYIFEFNALTKRIWQFFPLWYTVFFSDKVIVPSEHTKRKLLAKKWGKTPENIVVIPEGVSSVFKKYSSDEINDTQTKYGLKNTPYLIFISTIQPRKNIPNLVSGFSSAIKSGAISKDTLLVLVGKKGWDFEESLNSPKKYGVEKNVRFLGRVSDDDLPYLLAGASAFVSTSFEEGFGLPLLEAMASEVPCVISDIPSYKNISRGTQIFVDPYDPDSISQGLIKVLNSPNPENVQRAKEISLEYSWEETAKKTLKVFED